MLNVIRKVVVVAIIGIVLIGNKVNAESVSEDIKSSMGIFVQDHINNGHDVPAKFVKGQKVQVTKETDWGYSVFHNGKHYQVDRRNMIRTSKLTQTYEVIKETPVIMEIGGKPVRTAKVKEQMQIVNYEDDYGLFKTIDGFEAYVAFEDLKRTSTLNITVGVHLKDTVIGESDIVILAGEKALITDYSDNTYSLITEDKKVYKLNASEIGLSNKPIKATRGIIGKPNKETDKRKADMDKVVSYAKAQVGKRYVYATSGPNTYDCSGLTTAVYNQVGIKLTRTSIGQSKNGDYVAKSDLIPGDLVFFKTTSAPVGHTGVYIGNNEFVHASSSDRRVIVSKLDDSYYRNRFVVGRRMIK